MAEKKKILWLSDHPLVPSGVGTQSKYLIQGLLKTGKYRFVCGGGAIEHPDYTPQKIEPDLYGDDWVIYPVKGYGDKNFMRQMLLREKPDAVFIFTDPRFFVWLWEMEDEVRVHCPIIYWHVWDNDPAPAYNNLFYNSTDYIGALSLKTYGMLQKLGYKNCDYIPHSVSADVFKPLPEIECERFKRDTFGPHKDRRFVVFWNNRNARRKQTGDVIGTFAKFADIVGKDNVALMMHTAIDDPEGQDIVAVARCYDVENQLIISGDRVDAPVLNNYYNSCDCTINIASNEGFGLGTLESLYAGTPIIVHFTGGLQFQIGDWWEKVDDLTDQDKMTSFAKKMYNSGKANFWGVPVFTASRSCTGSQQIPYIYDDRVAHEDVVAALLKMYKMGRTARRELGLRAREWATSRFGMEKMVTEWDVAIEKTLENFKNSPPPRYRVSVI